MCAREMLDKILHTDFPTEESHIIKLVIWGEVLLKAYRIGIYFLSSFLSYLHPVYRIIMIEILYV